MIVGFADKETERFFVSGKSKRFPAIVVKTALRKPGYLNRSKTVQDLQAPPGNRLEALRGDLKGKYSIRLMINIGLFLSSMTAKCPKLK